MKTIWRTIDFRPAPVGWHAIVSSDDSKGWRALPVAGWLVQEEADEDPRTGEEKPWSDRAPEDRLRRVVAALHDELAEPFPADQLYGDSLWYVAGPGQPDPSEQDVKYYQEQQRIVDEHRRRRATP